MEIGAKKGLKLRATTRKNEEYLVPSNGIKGFHCKIAESVFILAIISRIINRTANK